MKFKRGLSPGAGDQKRAQLAGMRRFRRAIAASVAALYFAMRKSRAAANQFVVRHLRCRRRAVAARSCGLRRAARVAPGGDDVGQAAGRRARRRAWRNAVVVDGVIVADEMPPVPLHVGPREVGQAANSL